MSSEFTTKFKKSPFPLGFIVVIMVVSCVDYAIMLGMVFCR